MARIEPDLVDVHGKILIEQFHSPSDVGNDAAMQLCVKDTERAEAWLQNNYWSLRWREADALYQSPPGIQMWEGSLTPRANVNRFVVAETVNAILPQVTNGLFYEDPAFVLRPRPNEDENTTRAISALLATQLDLLHIRDEVKWGLSSALLFGTAIWKWGFRSYTKKVRKYNRAGNPLKVPSPVPGQPDTTIDTDDSVSYVRTDADVDIHEPTFENKDIRYILVEPGCHVPDIRKAKFVVDRMYLTYKDLIKLADEEYVVVEDGVQKLKKRYMLPSKEEIKSWFEEPKEQPAQGMNNETTIVQGTTFVHHAQALFQKTTDDPMDEPLEVLERWDNDKVITVLNRVKLIRNEPNEFERIPFLSVNWWDIPDAFWGLGLGRVIGVEQRVQAGLINACLDLANLIVNPMFVRASAANVQTQQIRQRIGGILTVETGGEAGPKSTKEAISILEQPIIPESVIQQISMSQQRVEMTSGASQQLTMGASTSGNKGGQLGRSGTGAAGMIQATMNRIGGFAEDFVRQVYEPLLYQLHTLNKEKMPMGYIKKLLGEQLGEDFSFDTDEFMTAPTEFEVLAGSHLAAKAQMAQSLFMMVQLFENAPLMQQLQQIDQKIVDIEELFHMIHDISGWKNYYKIIKPMDDQQKQAAQQMNNPNAAKLQGQMQLNQQKFGQDQQIIDQENEARSVRDILRVIAEKSAEPEALLGEAPTQGFGSNTQA